VCVSCASSNRDNASLRSLLTLVGCVPVVLQVAMLPAVPALISALGVHHAAEEVVTPVVGCLEQTLSTLPSKLKVRCCDAVQCSVV
jgi:hypothetical protein